MIIATYATEKKVDINSIEINVPFTTGFLIFFEDKIMQKKSIINTGLTTITDYKLMLVIFFFVFCPFVGMAA